MISQKLFKWILLVIAVLMFQPIAHTARADFDAARVVHEFNSMDGGKGYTFLPYMKHSSETKLWTEVCSQNPDLSAYSSLTKGIAGGKECFETFCLEKVNSIPYGCVLTGKLEYSDDKTHTASGKAVNFGVAVLYTQFATGTLANYNYANLLERCKSADLLQTAFDVLMGNATANWNQNLFLKALLNINSDIAFWVKDYDPSRYYREIGDYSVFVLNSKGLGTYQEDWLYVAKMPPSLTPAVPEPATLLLWLFGAGGACATTFCRRKVK